MEELAKLVGKRIGMIKWFKVESGLVLFLLFTDTSSGTFSITGNGISLSTHPGFTAVPAAKSVPVVLEGDGGSAGMADNPAVAAFNRELLSRFIRLWDKAGTTQYDKSEWTEFDAMLCQLGMRQG